VSNEGSCSCTVFPLQVIGFPVQFLRTRIARNNVFETQPVLDRSIIYRNISLVSEREAICNVDYPLVKRKCLVQRSPAGLFVCLFVCVCVCVRARVSNYV
jgi:hypothetical protein